MGTEEREIKNVRKASFFTSIQHFFFNDPIETFDQTVLVNMFEMDGTPDLEQLRQVAYDRIVTPEAFYRFRSLVALENGGVLFKELDPSVLDMEYHVNYAFPNGGGPQDMDELFVHVAELYDYENKMDDSQPMWQILLLPDFVDGRSIILFVVNHSIGDGASLTLAFSQLFDDQDADEEMKKELSKVVNKKRARKKFGLVSNIVAVQTILRRFSGSGDDANPLSKTSRSRSLGKTDPIPLDKIKDMQNALDGGYTVHDILCTTLNLAVAEYFKEVDPLYLKKKKVPKISCQYPMNMRPPTFDIEKEGPSNGYLSAGIFRMSFNYRNRLDLLRYIRGDIDLVRRSSSALVFRKVAGFLAWTSSEKKWRKRNESVNSQHTFLLSNNKGPKNPYFLLGHSVEDISGFALTSTANIFGVLSYKDHIRCSVCLDGAREPDAKKFIKYWNQEFQKLYDEALENGRPSLLI